MKYIFPIVIFILNAVRVQAQDEACVVLQTDPDRPPLRFLGFLIALFAVNLVHYFLINRISRRLSKSLLLLGILMGFFALFVALLPGEPLHRWVPVVLFVMLLAVIKLMARFEGKESGK